MAIITLTSDWQNDDFYVAAMKGHIYSQCPDARIIDITHRINGFSSADTAFVLKGSYRHFPEGTIHIICTNSEVSDTAPPLCVCHRGQYFIGADVRAFSVMFGTQPDHVFRLNSGNGLQNSTFPELTIFAQAACLIANGTPIEQLGDDITDSFSTIQLAPRSTSDLIAGNVLYIDSYKNVISNIGRKWFSEVAHGRNFRITFKNNIYITEKIMRTYSDVETGEFVALFNSLGLLELAIRNGRLAEMANIDNPGSGSIIIEFK